MMTKWNQMSKSRKKEYYVVAGIYLLSILVMLGYSIYQHTKRGFLQRGMIVTAVALLTFVVLYLLQEKREGGNVSLLELIIDWRYRICGVYFLLFCALGIHGFSTNIWNSYVPNGTGWLTDLFGRDNGITSDVWAIGIPQILNQIKTGMPLFNMDMMTQGENTVLAGLPALDLTLLGQPHYWGCLLGEWIGLAWLFWFKKFALLLGSYEVMEFLLKGKKKLALLGALILTTSPLMSWWFGHTVTVVVIYAQCCVASVIYYLRNIENTKKKILAAVCGGISAMGYVLGWYPALQVPFGYLMLILVIAALIRHKQKTGKLFGKQDVLILAVTFAAVGVVVGRFLFISWDSIQEVSATVFPGHRVVTGGGYSLVTAAYYLFEPLFVLVGPSQSNSCEASSIMPFIPVVYLTVIAVLVWAVRKKKIKEYGLMISLGIYCAFLISWLFVNYPEWFAKYTVFSYVTEARCIWCIAIISTYLGMMCLAAIWEHKIFPTFLAAVGALLTTGIFYFVLRNYFDMEYLSIKGYVPAKLILYGALAVLTIFNFVYLAGWKRCTAGLLVLMCLGFGISIQPLEQGTGSLSNATLAKEIQAVEEEDPDGLWLVEGSWVNANYVFAQGVHTFNTTNQYMDSEKWKALDPTGEQEEIYNRYAQVQVSLTEEETVLELVQGDLIQVYLNPDELEVLGIDYLVTTRVLEDWDKTASMVELVYADAASGQRVYRCK